MQTNSKYRINQLITEKQKMHTDTTEKGFEDLITKHLTETNGYELGSASEYNREKAIDEGRLFRFLESTQGEKLNQYNILNDEKKRNELTQRIKNEIDRCGIIDVLKNGVDFYPAGSIQLYKFLPSEKNQNAKLEFEKNIFSVTRQLKYSESNINLALDLAIFINGLPIITVELKNQLTKQNYENAIQQYKTDRDPRELLFHLGRCAVHFAVDDNEVWMCTQLKGKASRFMPFNKGDGDGAGNPPNSNGIKTNYLWKEILQKEQLADIIENYAQMTTEKDPDTKKTKKSQIFPRYHQLSVVHSLLRDVKISGVGKKYLIQHSAGSGKSNSIAWLALQLVPLEKDGRPFFDTVLIVTDRLNLDRQTKNTIFGIADMKNIVGHADSSSDLKELIRQNKKVIVTTVNKFPFILDSIGTAHRNKNFAIIIDEAHSSQSGRMSAAMNMVLSEDAPYSKGEDEDDIEDMINRIIESKKMLTNASYFAFTATPKNKTLEMFGTPQPQPDGRIQYRPFHEYTMKQAIQEGFILDVLQNYTPVASYFKLIKTVEDDPKFDKKKALKKLKAYVEKNDYTINEKAKIIVEHFHSQVINKRKINGKARAMVVCRDIKTAIRYYESIQNALEERKSPYKAIIAFSGEKEIGGEKLTESSINGFPSSAIEKTFKTEPYRFLVVANKFQTGYDEPLLHTMYVDKALSDVKAVQTLSRLNRAYPGKYDTFVLDFCNKPSIIKEAFDRYYKTTLLSDHTDPNKLYDLIGYLRDADVFTENDVSTVVENYLNGIEREQFDPVLDSCASKYINDLDLDSQIEFKSVAKTYLRTYGFLSSILPYGNPYWEKMSIFLYNLVPKLPTPEGEDLSKGIISAVDLESYRVEAQQTIKIILEDEDSEINPLPVKVSNGEVEPEMVNLSEILSNFHDMWGNIEWKDEDSVKRIISELPNKVLQDVSYQNAMKNSDEQNARIESDKVLEKIITSMITENIELYKKYSDDTHFRKWLENMVFDTTYNSVKSESTA